MRPPPPVVPFLAWAGRSTLFASAEKMGKSTLIGAVAAAVSTGGRFLDEPCERGTVLLVGLEEFIGDAARRFRQFGAEPARIYIADRLPADTAARPAALRALIDELHPTLVVVDSLIAYSNGAVSDAGSSAQMGPLVQSFTDLAHATGAALVLIHHARKADGNTRLEAIGGAVDVIAEMFAPEEATAPRKRVLRARGRVPTRDVAFHYVEEQGPYGLRGAYVRAPARPNRSRRCPRLRAVPSPRVAARRAGERHRRARPWTRPSVRCSRRGDLIDQGDGRNHAFAIPLAPRPAAAAAWASPTSDTDPVGARTRAAGPCRSRPPRPPHRCPPSRVRAAGLGHGRQRPATLVAAMTSRKSMRDKGGHAPDTPPDTGAGRGVASGGFP
jgi:hypothetical protein